MAEREAYADIVFPEYYADVFAEDDLDFRFRLVRSHIHPKLRVLLSACLDEAADVFETDPQTFSKMFREPRTGTGDAEKLRCALYGLRPTEVRGKGFPNLRWSSGRGVHVADFDLSFFADRDGLGLELHIGRQEELTLLEEVYHAYRDRVDALLTFVRLSVDGPAHSRLLSLDGMIREAREADGVWMAIFEPRHFLPIAACDVMPRFKDCFLGLYMVYDAMLCRALGIEDRFAVQFDRLEQHYRHI
ncbi:MAG: hypothetical protein ACE5JG_02080, partial [Planctomycetota bacterium]